MRRLGAIGVGTGVVGLVLMLQPASAQQERHGRRYKAPPPTANVAVTVEKAFNGKPMPNASVIFHAVRDGEKDANLETKTDPEGRINIDLLEVGSHVTVQVIASGFATYATDFDLTPDGKQVLVKMLRPRSQVTTYGDNTGGAATVQPGVQEHKPEAGAGQGAGGTGAGGTGAGSSGVGPTTATPPVPSPNAPMQTTSPVNPPAAAPGTPQ